MASRAAWSALGPAVHALALLLLLGRRLGGAVAADFAPPLAAVGAFVAAALAGALAAGAFAATFAGAAAGLAALDFVAAGAGSFATAAAGRGTSALLRAAGAAGWAGATLRASRERDAPLESADPVSAADAARDSAGRRLLWAIMRMSSRKP